MNTESALSHHEFIEPEESGKQAMQKPDWQAPSLSLLDLTLETCDGLLPSLDLSPASFVS